MDMTTMYFLAAVLIVGGLLFVIISLFKKGPKPLDVEKYRSRWLSIEQEVRRDETTSYPIAILNADKLLDKALTERGVAGKAMGERMKAAKTTWSNANALWAAHKLRNKIAHEDNFNVSYDDTRRALQGYKQALKDIGAI